VEERIGSVRKGVNHVKHRLSHPSLVLSEEQAAKTRIGGLHETPAAK
jgi:hypothetical protein